MTRTPALGWILPVTWLLAASAGCSDPVPPPPSPYPPSPVIARAEFEFSRHDRRAPGSDNWAITWADDDHQYTTWGDGGGFGGTNSEGRVSLGVARVEGSADEWRGVNLWGGKDSRGPAAFDGKSYGILAIGSTLYMWVGPGSETTSYREARLARSDDRGLTWTRCGWAFRLPTALIMPTFCQFGRGYEGARDGFVYSYFIRHVGSPKALAVFRPGQVDLARAPKDALFDRDAWEFYSGLDASGEPRWSATQSERVPVFEDPHGVGWCLSVSHNAGLGRYLLATEHSATFQGNFGLFDAPEPWGPWTTVAYESAWGDLGPSFFWNFSNKWLSEDGTRFTIVFTGVRTLDAWNSLPGRFVLRNDEPKPADQSD